MGKVSGVLGDAAAKLTMDDEYQEQRRRRAGGTDSIGRSVGGAAKVRRDMCMQGLTMMINVSLE